MIRSSSAWVLFVPLLWSCSGSEANSKASATGRQRDVEVHHEPCDAASSSARKVDVNGDGKPDIIHVMNGSREICRIVDLNLDGAVDAFIYYDERGQERRRESDFDRDGRADEIDYFTGGQIVRKERETNFDNKIDTWDYYEGSRLVKRERDSDGDGIVDQWWQFNNPTNPKCAIVATDRNADGKPDPDSVVDLCAESYGAPKGAPPSAPDAGAPSAAADAGAPPEPSAATPTTPVAAPQVGLGPASAAAGAPASSASATAKAGAPASSAKAAGASSAAPKAGTPKK